MASLNAGGAINSNNKKEKEKGELLSGVTL
jgi:hypothetical protein